MRVLGNGKGISGNSSPRKGKRVGITLLSLALLLAGSAARADTIRVVTTGSIGSNEDSNSFGLSGAGFRVSADGAWIEPLSPQCVIFNPCAPGTRINLSTSVRPSSLGDPAEVDGTIYTGGSIYGGPFFDGRFSIAAGSIAVPVVPVGGGGSAATPFTFSGWLSAYDNSGLSGTPLFSLNLVGRGTATMHFTNDPQFGGIFTSRLDYQFEDTAPVPEPATMLLLGTGLGGVVLRRMRRREQQA